MVSVIVPCYNNASTVGETLDSLKAQTLPEWEAVVVNDGSRDKSLEVIRSHASADQRIRHISQENLGLGEARNSGLKLAGGEFVVFLDADDILLPTMLERSLGVFHGDTTLDAVHCGWIFSDAPMQDRSWIEEATPQGDYFEKLAHGNLFPCHALVSRREIVERVGCFDGALKHCHDWDLWSRIARLGARFGCVSEPLVVYRMLPVSLSRRPRTFYDAGKEVIRRAHGADPRLAASSAEKLRTCACSMQASLRNWGLRCAGSAVAQGKVDEALDLLLDSPGANGWVPSLEEMAQVVGALWFSAAVPPGKWDELWRRTGRHLLDFAVEMEKRTGVSGSALMLLLTMSQQGIVSLESSDKSYGVNLNRVGGRQLSLTLVKRLLKRLSAATGIVPLERKFLLSPSRWLVTTRWRRNISPELLAQAQRKKKVCPKI